MGMVDRRAHGDRADAPRTGGNPSDPLDAEPADPRTRDEGDPAALQGRPAEAVGRADEVLQGEQDQPVRVLPADRLPDPDLHLLFFVLRDFEKEIFPKFPSSSLEWIGLVDITEPTKDGGARSSLPSTSSASSSTWLMSTSMQSQAQRIMIMVLPIVFLPFILGFPSGLMIYWLTTNLWTTGQGIVTRRLMPKPVIPPKRSSRTPPKESEVAARDLVRRARGRWRHSAHGTAAASEAEARWKGQAMSDSEAVTVETTGETVGEAKWAALRELELLVPGLDRESVEFQVVSEGERGLLGVGFTPAQVMATVVARPRKPRSESSMEEDVALEFVQRAAAAIGANVTASSAEDEGVVTVTCTGADLGLFIGKHGQTIDAIQYLANAMVRSQGGERGVVVDAAGYRARRTATLETMAKRTAQRICDRSTSRARADDARRAEDRSRGAQGRSGGRDAERGLGAEPVRRRPPQADHRLTCRVRPRALARGSRCRARRHRGRRSRRSPPCAPP